MSGGKGSSSTSTVQIPEDVLANYRAVNANAQQVAKTPFQTYSGQFVAPLTATQQAGINATNTASTQAQPYYTSATNTLNAAQAATQPYYQGATQSALNAAQTGAGYNTAATGLAAAGAQAVNPTTLDANAINQYLSPYLKDVVGSEAALLNQNNQQAMSGQLGTAISSGAFGGDRAGIAAANLAQQQQLANANIFSNLLNQGYNTALGTAQQQQGVGLSAAQANRAALSNAASQIAGIGNQAYTQGNTTASQLAGLGQGIYNTGAATSSALANLGTGAQNAALQGASAQLAAGQAEQSTQQAQDTALYNQFLQQQSYPFQVAQFLANIAEGTGSLSGSTTTTNTTSNGIFSDERLKEDIEPVGKTFDGQTIYSYRYKGDKTPQIGLMAQEVEKRHPEAVGLAGGYKTVDYGKATEDAAERGKFAAGGVAGGFDPATMAQLVASYQSMYGPLLSHGANSLTGAGGIVPASTGSVGQLHPAQAEIPAQQSLAGTVNDYASAANSIGSLGDKLGVWDYGSDDDSRTKRRSAHAAGGVAPYGQTNGLDIPDDQQHYTLTTAKNNAPDPNKPLDDALKTAAQVAMMFAKRGGRIKRAEGGSIPNSVLDSILKKLRPWEHEKPHETDWDNDGAPGESEDHLAPSSHAAKPAFSAGSHEEPLIAEDAALASSKTKPAELSAPSPAGGAVADLIARAEGTGKNPLSSAQGPFQFLNSTFRQYVGKVDPGMAKEIAGMSDRELSAYRATNKGVADVERAMGHKLTEDNAAMLQKAGFEASPGKVYLAHLLGPKGALSVLKADPSTPLSELERRGALTKGTLAANPIGNTAADAVRWAEQRIERAAKSRKEFADGGVADDTPPDMPDFNDTKPSREGIKVIDVAPEVKAVADRMAPAAERTAPAPSDTGWEKADVEPHRGFFKGLGHGDASSIIPLLAGVGALATTQTNNPLTAIAAGLGAGAQAAQGQRQFALEQRKTEAERLAAQTGYKALPLQAQRAAADYQQAINGTVGQLNTWLQMYQPIATSMHSLGMEDAVKPLDAMIAAANSKIRASTVGGLAPLAGAAAPAASGLAPGAQPQAEAAPVSPNFGKVDFSNPASLQNTGAALTLAGVPGGSALSRIAEGAKQSGTMLDAQGRVVPVQGAIPTAIKQQVAGDVAKTNIPARADIAADAKAANEALNSAAQLRGLLLDENGKPKVLGGPLEKFRTGVGSILLSAGISPDIADAITRTDVTNSQAANKLRAALSSAAARGELGASVANHPGEFRTFLDNTPGTQLPTAVSKWLIDKNLIPKARNTMALSEYINRLDLSNPATDVVREATTWRAAHPWEESLQKRKTLSARPTSGKPLVVRTAEDYASVKPGATYVDAQGNKRVKPKGNQ